MINSLQGSTTKYLSDMYSGEDEQEDKSQVEAAKSDPIELSAGIQCVYKYSCVCFGEKSKINVGLCGV